MRVTNIVTLWDLGKRIPIQQTVKNFKANKIQENSHCLLVYESGKIIATGFKTLKETRMFLKKTFSSAKLKKVVNMTAITQLKGKIDLNLLEYEPEIYPAYIWKRGSKTVVYYRSGKLVITGVTSLKELRHTYNEFKESTKYKSPPDNDLVPITYHP